MRSIFLAAAWISSIATYGSAQELSFNRDIRPLLSDRCFHCHGPDEQDRQAGLRLDRAEGSGGAYEWAIVPGSPQKSELYARIMSDDPDTVMPPPDSHKQPLTEQEKERVRKWIEQGAEYQNFWAFEAPVMPQLSAELGVAPIDFFVRQRLRQEGLAPSAPAEKRALIRRLSFDLTGLPPTLAEINDFLSDDSPAAYERVVDRLLNSPHYGEHMAKYWLDLVRFADTNGIHHDHYRELSTYRDWVIRAFNDNLPYDDFVRYQLAGDLYPQPTKDQLIASGFHRLHLIIDVGTALPEESFTRNVLDRVTSVGTAFMGLTVQCAVCHDHKYDPITMRDFYSLYAFFNNIDAEPETGRRSGTDFQRGLQPPYINLPSREQTLRLADLSAEVAAAKARLASLKAALKSTDLPDSVLDESDAGFAELVKQAEQVLKAAETEHDRYLLSIPAAMIMKERTEVRPAHILIRGAYDKPGDVVPRATPAFLPPMDSSADTPSRMDLANWLVDPQHPLTARVAVNRFWQQLFGVGIVRTAEDFGAQGEWPSHPELLDYLAIRFQSNGWNVRQIIKEMVMSETYQQESSATPEAFQSDPNNRLLARASRFRMDSELIRDQVLASSGLLSYRLYGKSVKPPQPAGLWTAVSMPSSYPKEFQADEGEAIYRRSLYTFWKRGMPPPQMTILNAPSREECIARRERTNTPLQALLLLNEQEYLKAACNLAANVLEQDGSELETIRTIYETITTQLPTDKECVAFQSLLSDLEATYHTSPELAQSLCGDITLPKGITAERLAAYTLLASTIYNLDITKTRQ
ncbi:MAG: PSD1 and planctomycete cytochrome C domain-containing protein [bacterium]|nr:PSD1 and planctomycete cytochrome C domain-containing protein [bacterium]